MKITGPNAEVSARHDWTDGLATFSVKPIGWQLPDFIPGQFANLAMPSGDDWDTEHGKAVRRAYSIASSPGQDALEFFIRRVDDGELTPSLFNLQPGHAVHLDQRIAGHFTLEGAQPAEDLVLVGTGTGVAPYRPMVLQEGVFERFGRVILLYSDRYVHDLGYIEEFEALAKKNDRFHFFPTITGDVPESDWAGLRGRVQTFLTQEAYERLTGKPLTPDRAQVYLCGNPKMVIDVQASLEGYGFVKHKKREPGQIHMEKYW